MIQDFEKFVKEAKDKHKGLKVDIDSILVYSYDQVLNLFHALTATVSEDDCITFDLTNDERSGPMGCIDGYYAYPAVKQQLDFELDSIEDFCNVLISHVNSMRERLTALDEHRKCNNA